ncbi:hypothetical protein M0802_013893 [Mischocyttarus mexicanus]|nr:hypothetical protein M0802_013893 [Mischocyttarus mexicanus]
MGSNPASGNSRMEREQQKVVTSTNNFRSEQCKTGGDPANRKTVTIAVKTSILLEIAQSRDHLVKIFKCANHL